MLENPFGGFSKNQCVYTYKCHSTLVWIILEYSRGPLEVCSSSEVIRIFFQVIACLMWSSQVPAPARVEVTSNWIGCHSLLCLSVFR